MVEVKTRILLHYWTLLIMTALDYYVLSVCNIMRNEWDATEEEVTILKRFPHGTNIPLAHKWTIRIFSKVSD